MLQSLGPRHLDLLSNLDLIKLLILFFFKFLTTKDKQWVILEEVSLQRNHVDLQVALKSDLISYEPDYVQLRFDLIDPVLDPLLSLRFHKAGEPVG